MWSKESFGALKVSEEVQITLNKSLLFSETAPRCSFLFNSVARPESGALFVVGCLLFPVSCLLFDADG